MLSQKAKPEDVSLVEYLIAHLIHKGELNAGDLASFKPGICNRLDRNTSGIVAAGKTTKDYSSYRKHLNREPLESTICAL